MFLAYGALGLAVGSFVNVCIDRLPEGGSLISPRSRCTACGRQLSALELIPVVSYLFLRGRCRACSSPIPVRVLLVELTMGAAFAILWSYLGPGVEAAVYSFYAAVFVLVTAIDLERHLILNKVIYPCLLLAPFAAAATGVAFMQSLAGGVSGFLLLLLPFLLARGGMGAGDVKLAAFIGLITGFPGVAVALFAAVVTGGIASAVLLAGGVKGRKDPVPFGPFLVAGGAAALMWGEPVISWYLTVLGV